MVVGGVRQNSRVVRCGRESQFLEACMEVRNTRDIISRERRLSKAGVWRSGWTWPYIYSSRRYIHNHKRRRWRTGREGKGPGGLRTAGYLATTSMARVGASHPPSKATTNSPPPGFIFSALSEGTLPRSTWSARGWLEFGAAIWNCQGGGGAKAERGAACEDKHRYSYE